MKRSLFLIISVFVIIFQMSGQSEIQLNNYFWNTSIINPAYMVTDYSAQLDIAYRNQWTNFPGAPKTLYAAGSYYIEDLHTKIGLRVMQDKIGYTTSTDVNLIYSYATKLGYYWRIQMGLALSYQNESYDLSQVNAETPTDPAIQNLYINKNLLNADIGFELTDESWTIGGGGRNIASAFRKDSSTFVNTNFGYIKYQHPVNDYIDFSYMLTGIQTKYFYQGEFNFTSYFNVMPDERAFQVGAFYRTRNEMGVMFGIDLTKNLKLYYNYDYNISGISRSSVGSHEIMMTFSLDKAYKCNCWY